MKNWQIMRFNNGRQEHYDFAAKNFKKSADRWDGKFPATEANARGIFAPIQTRYRRTNVMTIPKLHEII